MTKDIEKAVNKIIPILEPFDELAQEIIVGLALVTLQKKEREYIEELKSLR